MGKSERERVEKKENANPLIKYVCVYACAFKMCVQFVKRIWKKMAEQFILNAFHLNTNTNMDNSMRNELRIQNKSQSRKQNQK